MATMTVLDSVGATQTVEKPLAPGRAAAASSRPVALSTEDAAFLDGIETALALLSTAANQVTEIAILGAAGDAASPTTTIKAALRQIATATGSTAFTRGGGASDANTLRTTIDTSQLGSLVAGGVPVVSGGYEYETVAAGQSDQILGATGAVGDYLESLLCVVATAATSQVQIKDGNGTAITIQPNAVGAGVGTYPIPIGLTCINATTPGWKITTAAGVSVLATGNFT